MITFVGRRTSSGCVVTVNGGRLPLYLQFVNHSPTGFEWGYAGSGPAQLAFAMLYEYFTRTGNANALNQARSLYQRFKDRVVSRFNKSTWEYTGEQIAQFLEDVNG